METFLTLEFEYLQIPWAQLYTASHPEIMRSLKALSSPLALPVN